MKRVLKIDACAKINLALYVLNRRKDGFHNIETVFQSISLKDRLIIRESPEIKVTCDNPAVPAGRENLVFQAALLLKKAFRTGKNAHIHIEKRIPMGAGLAGGSADAAAAVKGLVRFWGLGKDAKRIQAVLRRLGLDVPFCFEGGTRLGRGRGERLAPLPPFPKRYVAVVNPGVHVATPWAYRGLRRTLTLVQKKANLKEKYADLIGGRLTPGEFLHNDFEDLVLKAHPVIRRIRDAMVRFHPEGVLMSGSGSTVFALFRRRPEAARAIRYFNRQSHFTCLSATPGGTRA